MGQSCAPTLPSTSWDLPKSPPCVHHTTRDGLMLEDTSGSNPLLRCGQQQQLRAQMVLQIGPKKRPHSTERCPLLPLHPRCALSQPWQHQTEPGSAPTHLPAGIYGYRWDPLTPPPHTGQPQLHLYRTQRSFPT